MTWSHLNLMSYLIIPGPDGSMAQILWHSPRLYPVALCQGLVDLVWPLSHKDTECHDLAFPPIYFLCKYLTLNIAKSLSNYQMCSDGALSGVLSLGGLENKCVLEALTWRLIASLPALALHWWWDFRAEGLLRSSGYPWGPQGSCNSAWIAVWCHSLLLHFLLKYQLHQYSEHYLTWITGIPLFSGCGQLQ